jgi:hypothetical protein
MCEYLSLWKCGQCCAFLLRKTAGACRYGILVFSHSFYNKRKYALLAFQRGFAAFVETLKEKKNSQIWNFQNRKAILIYLSHSTW